MNSRTVALLLLFVSLAPHFFVGQSEATTPAVWVEPSWQYRIPFEAVSDSIAGPIPHVDFPMLVSLDEMNGADMFANAKIDGTDLLFTMGDGTTVLEHELVGFDVANTAAEIWVKVPALSSSENFFYLYYGNPDTTIVPSPAAAWKSSYRAVFHFADDPGLSVLTDSSPRQGHVSIPESRMWTSEDSTSAQIHQGWFFNGTTHQIGSRAVSTQDSSYVVSAWVKSTATGSEFFMQALPGYWSTQTVLGTPGRPAYQVAGLSVSWNPGGGELPVNQGYHHFAWVFDGVADTIEFYFDGVAQQVRGTFPSDASPFYTGRPINPDEKDPVGILGPMYFNPGDYMEGGGDEFRVHEGTLSAEWILTEYRNQKSPEAFLDFGVRESSTATAVGPSSPQSTVFMKNAPNPFGGATAIQYFLPLGSHVQLMVYDISGRCVRELVDERREKGWHVSHWDGRTSEGRPVARGVYFLRLATPGATRSLKVVRVQ